LVTSSFIVLARLSDNQEVLAFQLGGYSLKQIAYPIIVIGLLVSFAAFGVNNYLVPWANFEYRKKVYRVASGNPLPRIQSDLFFKDPSGSIFYVGRYNEREKRAEEIVIFSSDGLDLSGVETPGTYPELLTSESGVLTEDGWELTEGQVVGLDRSGNVNYTMEFEKLKVGIDRSVENLVFDSRKTDEMGLRELWVKYRAAEQAGKATAKLNLALHSRFSRPLAGLVFVLFSAPLSLLLRHRSKAVGIILALVSVGGYQGVLLWASSSARQTILQPATGAWLPNIIFGALGLILLFMLDKTGFSSPLIRLNLKTRSRN
ncbi:MAG: LptF/LptG family permease, partial [Candidatus Bipolaricaulota bacterium]